MDNIKKKILIIDDSTLYIKKLIKILNRDYDVSFETNGKDAIKTTVKAMPICQ